MTCVSCSHHRPHVLAQSGQGRAPSGLQGPARHPSRMTARKGGAVHTRFGLNHSRPPDVSIPGSKQAAGWDLLVGMWWG